MNLSELIESKEFKDYMNSLEFDYNPVAQSKRITQQDLETYQGGNYDYFK